MRYFRKETYAVETIIDKFKGNSSFYLNEDLITPSARYQLFYKSVTCVKCKLVGTYFAKERNLNSKKFHLNLYGLKDGEEILFTKDHILPKSKGGLDRLDNYQTMCEPCNKAKGNANDDDFLKS